MPDGDVYSLDLTVLQLSHRYWSFILKLLVLVAVRVERVQDILLDVLDGGQVDVDFLVNVEEGQFLRNQFVVEFVVLVVLFVLQVFAVVVVDLFLLGIFLG